MCFPSVQKHGMAAVLSSKGREVICSPLAVASREKIMADEMTLKLFYDFCLSCSQKEEIKKRINFNL